MIKIKKPVKKLLKSIVNICKSFKKNPPAYCQYMMNHLIFSYEGSIGYCRPYSVTDSIPYDKFDLNKYILDKKKHQKKLLKGEYGKCSGCTYLIEGEPAKSEYMINYLDLNFSTFCNLSCAYCYIPVEKLRKKDLAFEEKGFEFFKKILDKKLLNPNGYVSFSGGEPTITSVFPKVCLALKKYSSNLSYTFITNCTYLSDEIIELMKSNSQVSFMISIDSSNSEIYKEVKGRDLFDKVIENLNKYIELSNKFPNNTINLKYILMPQNMDYVCEFLDLVQSKGLKHVYFDINGFGNDDCAYMDRAIPTAIKFCIEASKRGIEPRPESTGLYKQETKDKIMSEYEKKRKDN